MQFRQVFDDNYNGCFENLNRFEEQTKRQCLDVISRLGSVGELVHAVELRFNKDGCKTTFLWRLNPNSPEGSHTFTLPDDATWRVRTYSGNLPLYIRQYLEDQQKSAKGANGLIESYLS